MRPSAFSAFQKRKTPEKNARFSISALSLKKQIVFFFFFFHARPLFFPFPHPAPQPTVTDSRRPTTVVQAKRGRPPVSALIRRDGRGSLRLDLWLPPAPPGAGAADAAAASKAAAAETPSGEVPSIAPGASPEQRRLWFADLLFNRERAFFARLAAEAAAAIEASAPAWQVPVAALLCRLDELERAEKEQQQLQLRQQLRGVGISGGGPPPSSSSSCSHSAHQQGGSAGTAASSASSLGLGPFAWPRELCSTERNAAAAASAAVDAAGAEAERADNADDAGASSALPGGQGGDALGGTKSGEATATATATTTTPSMALLLRAECLSHIPHMRVVSAQIGGEAFLEFELSFSRFFSFFFLPPCLPPKERKRGGGGLTFPFPSFPPLSLSASKSIKTLLPKIK